MAHLEGIHIIKGSLHNAQLITEARLRIFR